MKRFRISAIAAAGVMAVSALIGINGTGTASASALATTNGHLCTRSANGASTSVCAVSHGSGNNVGMAASGASTLNYPSGNNAEGYIKASSTLCLQINAGGGYAVREAACIGDTAETWINVYNPTTKRTEFHALYSDANYGSLCLSYDKNDGILKADPCLDGATGQLSNYWYQQFASS